MILIYISKIRHSTLRNWWVFVWARLHFPYVGENVNQRSLNFPNCHEAAATDHPWLSSDTTIWSLGIGQFSRIRMPLRFGVATTVKYVLTNKTSIFRNQRFFHDSRKMLSFHTIQSFIQPSKAFCIG